MEFLALVFALTLGVSGRSNANVTLASNGHFVVATWSASLPTGATDIYAAVSRDDGRTFTSPVRVNSTPGSASVNGEQPPRAALAPRAGGVPAITVVWTAKGTAGTVLMTAESTDGGRAFKPARIVPGTDAAGNRGWESIAMAPDGTPVLVWLDHRRLAERDAQAASTHHEHGGAMQAGDGVAMAQLSQLYVARLAPAQTPRAVTGGVCYCCKTAVATGAGGAVFAAWRHVYAGNLRDIAFTVSRDGGRSFSPPVRVSEDKWQLEGCPDDGPAMTVEPDGRVHLVWPTLVTVRNQQTIGLYYSQSEDGIRFLPRQALPTEGLAHHPQIIGTRAGGLVTAWDELNDGARRIVVGRSSAAGSVAAFRRESLSDSAGGVYPALATTEAGVLVAWTSGAGENASIKLRAVDVR